MSAFTPHHSSVFVGTRHEPARRGTPCAQVSFPALSSCQIIFLRPAASVKRPVLDPEYRNECHEEASYSGAFPPSAAMAPRISPLAPSSVSFFNAL